jgi:hypothetical protein
MPPSEAQRFSGRRGAFQAGLPGLESAHGALQIASRRAAEGKAAEPFPAPSPSWTPVVPFEGSDRAETHRIRIIGFVLTRDGHQCLLALGKCDFYPLSCIYRSRFFA